MAPELEKLVNIVRVALIADQKGGELVNKESIEATVKKYAPLAALSLDETALRAAVAELEKIFNVWSGKAGFLRDVDSPHKKWLPAKKGDISWCFWSRYRTYLEDKFPPQIVEEMDSVTEDILGELEDPVEAGAWRRQGLVVGHVQSGKTANYTGLICKAADAGFKVVIVLSGIHNSLRAQTQIRLDEGFLGYARPFDGSQKHGAPIGVGRIDSSLKADTVTTRDEKGDFSTAKAAGYQFHAGGNVLLFVVKKHKTVLSNLIHWAQLSAKESDASGEKVVAGIPLLVIDDEADQASIDTNFPALDEDGHPDPEHDPTAINGLIRDLLQTFQQCAYIGYTATPFANVFIHHKTQHDKHGPDLFPRDFIVNLTAPSDYFGPAKVFGSSDSTLPEGGKVPSRLRFIEDAGEWSPPTHKSVLVPRFEGRDSVPPSLERAIRSFLVGAAARCARGEERAHKSMLVHVTRFTKVQELVHRQIAQLIEDYRVRWRARLVTKGDSLAEEFRSLWTDDFIPTSLAHGESAPPWELVEPHLATVLSAVKVNLINAKASDALIYEEYANAGLTVIAVGGDKLSRGLTLEGLTTSYFLRASRMYDTLMQMGRWFGYRPGYEDLCRLYLSEELAEWYSHITNASEELRAEFDRMVLVGGKPLDYGFRVQSHPNLAITGKLRPGLREIRTSLSATPFEPTVFLEEKIKPNWDVTERFLRSLGTIATTGIRHQDAGLTERRGNWPGSIVWVGVAGSAVLQFVREFKFADKVLTRTPSQVVVAYMVQRQAVAELKEWTVVLLGKSPSELDGEPRVSFDAPGSADSLDTLYRSYHGLPRKGLYVVKRVGSPKDESVDLTESEWSSVLSDKARIPSRAGGIKEWTQGRLIRGARPKERGLLILYALTPRARAEDAAEQVPMIAPYISFPFTKSADLVTYTLTDLRWEQEQAGIE